MTIEQIESLGWSKIESEFKPMSFSKDNPNDIKTGNQFKIDGHILTYYEHNGMCSIWTYNDDLSPIDEFEGQIDTPEELKAQMIIIGI